MKIKWNNMTWSFKLLAFTIFVLFFYIGFNLKNNKTNTSLNNQPAYIVNSSSSPWYIYKNDILGFSIRYPASYKIDDTYKYQEFGPGKDISGIKFTISESMATGTNLGSDSYISVERIQQTKNCSATLFINQETAHTLSDNGIKYSVASSTGAGAGNRYEETVYAVTSGNSCIAVRYFIHYSVFENYPPNTVKEFDRSFLINQFDAIRRTFVIL